MINVFGHNLIENTSERQIYTLCGGLIKVVSGTKIVSITKNIGYTRLFSIEELKKCSGAILLLLVLASQHIMEMMPLN